MTRPSVNSLAGDSNRFAHGSEKHARTATGAPNDMSESWRTRTWGLLRYWTPPRDKTAEMVVLTK